MVLSLLTMPSAAGLFRAAISQSGAPSFRSFDDHERVGRQLAATIGIQPTAEEWARVPIDALLARQAALMMAWDRPELPPHPLLGSLGLALADGEAAFLPFSPVYGDETLPDNLYSAIENGVASTIPVLLGSNADEFVGDAPYMTDADIRHWASAINAGASRTAELIALHAGGERDPFGRMMTDLFFRAPIAEIVSRRRSTASATWTYDFRWTGPGGLASHCLELPFTWNNLQAEGVSAALGSTPPQALADSMHGALCSFIAGGAAPWAMDSSSGATRVWDNSGARDGSSPYRSTHPLILPKG
jgi:para-nitrobenzyl esterase